MGRQVAASAILAFRCRRGEDWVNQTVPQKTGRSDERIQAGDRLARGVAMAAVAGFLALAMVAADAEAARRFGGGKSFGRQSQNVERQQMQPPARDAAGQAAPGQQGAQSAGPTGQPQPARNRWMGPLAGLAAGLGIAALLSAFGLSGAFAKMLGSLLVVALLVGAALFVWRMLRGAGTQARHAAAPGAWPRGARRGREPDRLRLHGCPSGQRRCDPGSAAGTPPAVSSASSVSSEPWGVPADFDVEGFLRNAKVHFIRLQAAWDAQQPRRYSGVHHARGVCRDPHAAQRRDRATTHTDVVSLAARLLGIEETDSDYVASVRFDGSIREGQGAAEPVAEVWNLSKPKRGNRGWLLAGVQQLQ